MTTKTILITGATDGIGLATAKQLAANGHTLLIHGRNPDKLAKVADQLQQVVGAGIIETYVADLSDFAQVRQLAEAVKQNHDSLDVLINNAGVFKTPSTQTADGLDMRFMVNTFAPYILTQELLPLLQNNARVVNLSSAAQQPVSIAALKGETPISDDMAAYAQSKLAITMWTQALSEELRAFHGKNAPMLVSVNPASLLATTMVNEAFGVPGKDVTIGADILCRAALSDEFDQAHGQYYDNDNACFANPHTDAQNADRVAEVMAAIEEVCERFSG